MPVVSLTNTNSVMRGNYVDSDAPNTSYETNTSLFVGTKGSTSSLYRSFLFFDLGLIPNNAIINSAVLKLYKLTGNTNKIVRAHKVTSQWTEGVTHNTQPSIGSEYGSALTNATNTTYDIDLKALVQEWVDGTSKNYGIALKGDETVTASNISLGSDNNLNAPILMVDYTIPTTGKKQVEYVGNARKSTSSPASSFAATVPSGVQVGDFLALHVNVYADTTLNTPSGWTLQRRNAITGSYSFYLFTKTAVSGEVSPSFTTGASTHFSANMMAFRNVKSLVAFAAGVQDPSTQFGPGSTLSNLGNNALVALSLFTPAARSFAPPKSYEEKYEASDALGTISTSMRYLHDTISQTITEMTSSTSSSSGSTFAFALEPNNPPTLTLTNPANNQTIKQGTDINFQWTGNDQDSDALTYTLQVGTSQGASNIYNTSVGSVTFKSGISTAWALGLYYWRVIADDGKGGVATSTEGTFGLAKGNLVTLTKDNSVAKDTYISQQSPTTAFASSTWLYTGSNTVANTAYRSLLIYDLGLIPNNAIINSATLNIKQASGANNGTNRTIGVHAVLGSWDNNTTWNTTPGFDPIPVSTLVYGLSASGRTFDVKTLVQQWVNGSVQNNGFMLKDQDESVLNSYITNASTDSATQADRPTLTIDYTIPTTGKKQVEVVSGVQNTYVSGTSASMNLPASTQGGDLVVLQMMINSNVAVTVPSGWTKQADAVNTNTGFRHLIITKTIASGEANPQFSAPGAVTWMCTASVFRNVKSISGALYTVTGATASYTPTAGSFNVSVDNDMYVLLNQNSTGNNGTPPLSYNELFDDVISGSSSVKSSISFCYMHKRRSQTSEEMKTILAGPAYGISAVMALEPITNNPPTLSLTSPANNQTLSEGNTYKVEGSATDADNGNVVTVKYKINNGSARALQSGVSNGSTPISFAKTLTYGNKRIWDGSTDVAGVDLAENTNHTLTVWTEDDQGGKSAEVTRTFKVIWNRPPVISGTNENLGTILVPPTKNYSVTEPETDTFTITEKINGTIIDSFIGVAGRQETITIPHDLWIRLDLGIPHSLIVEATDSKGLKSTRTYTFVRTETHIEFLLNFDNPDVAAHFTPDGMPERVLLTLERYIPEGANIESVKVCNNALDATPTWEDATSTVKSGRGYLFTNSTKTAASWRINIWVIIAKGTATERVRLNGYGGAYD
ncbi:DNRLRE domain-containing protein [Brevibacillus choshinensis]|uniref:DNRLRE domain-containing protein n=1 Tax=Brevibacillus choshinensis TaxID=54911 RepID=UPI002E1D6494|nr:DNRLRE domain-containing protein [Brevibacillus choshinensis]